METKHTPWTLQQNGAFADILEDHKHVASGVEINRAGRIVRAVNTHEAFVKLARDLAEGKTDRSVLVHVARLLITEAK